MAAALNQKAFERKLQNMSSTQDSVQTVSLWMIHHKKHAADMVRLWLDQLRKAKPDRRLVFFYLANDVLQNSRKKGTEWSHAFNKPLREAAPLLGDPKIRSSVERVIKIWAERKVFEKDYLETLRSKLDGAPSKSARKAKDKPPARQKSEQVEHKPKNEKRLPPADFKPSKLIDTLSALRDFEAELTLKQSHLSSLRIDASDLQAVHQLKDRAGGAKFWEEHGEATAKLEEFCETLKKEQEYRQQITTVLEDGEAFYDAAYGEVKVIVHAYKSFGNRLNSLKKKLDHKVNKLAVQAAERAKTGCVSAPGESFLSSGLPDLSGTPSSTPPQSESKPTDPTVDNTEVADMDIEDDSDSEASPAGQEQSNGSSQEGTSQTSTPQATPSLTSGPATQTTASPAAAAAQTQAAPTTAPQTTPSATPLTPAPVVGPNQTIPPVFMPPLVMAPQAVSTQLPIPSYGNIPPPFPVLPQTFVPVVPGMAPQVVQLQGPGQGAVLPSQVVPGSLVPAQGTQMPEQPRPLTPPPRLPATLTQPGSAPLAGATSSSLPTSGKSAEPVVPVSVVSTTSSKAYSPTQAGNASPGSEGSAPSPVGSPELNLDDDTPETTPAPMGDVSFDFPGNPAFKEAEVLPKSASIMSSTDVGSSAGSTPSSAGQAAGSGGSQPHSAVSILAKLLSKGRQLQKVTTDSPPVEEVPKPVVQEVPKESAQGRPLLSLIDSLFPKLSDSIKTLKEKEQGTNSPTPRSPAGNPSQADEEALKLEGLNPLHEERPFFGVPFEAMGPGHNPPVHRPPGDHVPLEGGPGAPDGRRPPFSPNTRSPNFHPGRAPIRGPSLDGPFAQRHHAPVEGMFHEGRAPTLQGPPTSELSGPGLTSPTHDGPPFRQVPPFSPEGQRRNPHEELPFERRDSGFPRAPFREGPPFVRGSPEGGNPRQEPSHPPHSNHDRYPNNVETPGEGLGQNGPPPEHAFSNPAREGPPGPPGNRRHSDDRGPRVMHHGPPGFRGRFPGPPGRGHFPGTFMPRGIPRRNSQGGHEQREPAGAAFGSSENIDYCEDDPSGWNSFETSDPPRGPGQLANNPDGRFRERTFHSERNFAENQRPRFMTENMHPRGVPMKRPLPPPPFPPGHLQKRPFC